MHHHPVAHAIFGSLTCCCLSLTSLETATCETFFTHGLEKIALRRISVTAVSLRDQPLLPCCRFVRIFGVHVSPFSRRIFVCLIHYILSTVIVERIDIKSRRKRPRKARNQERRTKPAHRACPRRACMQGNSKKVVIIKAGFQHQLLFTQALETPHSMPCMVFQLRCDQRIKTVSDSIHKLLSLAVL